MGQSSTPSTLRPLTERILAYLPGSRFLWIPIWALVPWLNAGANLLLDTDERSAIWEQSRTLVIVNYAALTVAVAVTLWGADRIARRLEAIRGSISEVLEQVDSRKPFREVSSVVGPLALAAGGALAFGLSALVQDGLAPSVIRGSTWFVLGVALWTFLWVYFSLQFGLNRLGRNHLAADAVHVDPGLGLTPLGGVAFMGLWMLLVAFVPVLLTGLSDVVGFVLGVAVLGLGLAFFFLSLFRLHRQMVAVKANELAVARDLYAQAYEPLRSSPTLELLDQQHTLLGAADVLEKRAEAIHDWPMDEGTWARVLTIATSVVAITIGRLILNPLGL
jgi:hypothetical protein